MRDDEWDISVVIIRLLLHLWEHTLLKYFHLASLMLFLTYFLFPSQPVHILGCSYYIYLQRCKQINFEE